MLGQALGFVSTAMQLLAGNRENKKNIEFQKQTNKDNYQYGWDMYNKQRQDALTDVNSQNQYNSPKQTMQRLKEAGLSPNLVYGNGAQSQTAQIRGSSSSPGSAEAPKVDNKYMAGAAQTGLNAANSTLQYVKGKVETDNLQKQADLLVSQKLNVDADTNNKLQTKETSAFTLEQLQRNADEMAKKLALENQKTEVEIPKIQADTQYTLDANQRAAIMQSFNIKKTVQDIITQKINNSKTELEKQHLQKIMTGQEFSNKIKEFEAGLTKAGITPGGGVVQNAASIIATLWKNIFGD